MKEYIKKFDPISDAHLYPIETYPFITTGKCNGGSKVNLHCKVQNKGIETNQCSANLVDMVVITGTWNPSVTNKDVRAIIRGNVVLTGKTDCYSLMFEEGGHLTINAGARLRVWQGGIVNNDCTTVNYLTIVEDAVNDVYGEFLLHPDVTVNNHPMASVIHKTYSYYAESSDYQWDRFGVPTHNAIKSITSSDGFPTSFSVATINGWQSLGFINYPGRQEINPLDFNKPFVTYEMVALRAKDTVPPTYNFTGELLGNINITLTVNKYQTAFNNSYSARISTKKLLIALQQSGIYIFENLKYAIIQKGTNAPISWVDLTLENVDTYPYIVNSYSFLIEKTYSSAQSFDFTLSYKDLVWDPSFEEEVTPTRSLMKGTITSPKPIEIDTTLEGSGIFDNPELPFPPEHDER